MFRIRALAQPFLRQAGCPIRGGYRTTPNRGASLLAWGRNAEGQCGGDEGPVVYEPTRVFGLAGDDIRGLMAGKLSSGAVTSDGEAWTWGEGKAGKLGHGNGLDVPRAQRVEALVGRSSLQRVSMGDTHTLFLGGDGRIWGCGENKEGQLGLGTPLEVIADQHRQAYYQSVASPGPGGSSGGLQELVTQKLGGSPATTSQQRSLLPPPDALNPMALSATKTGARGRQGGDFDAMRSRLQQQVTEQQAAATSLMLGTIGLGGLQDLQRDNNMKPGQVHSPARLGTDKHPLGILRHHAADGDGVLSDAHLGSLEDEFVIDVSGSSYFSAAVTSRGEVWTFGACFNGSLGGDSNWSTSARRVSDPLASLLAEHGGAVSVVTGSSFCACLTASGRVVAWGKLPAPLPATAGDKESMTGALAPLGLGGRVTVSRSAKPTDHTSSSGVIVPKLPAIKHIAAGRNHVIVSDGETVWGFGRWMDDEGEETGGAPFSDPSELLRLPLEGVASVHCGPHCAGVISGSGQVWMWGRLLDRDNARLLLQKESRLGYAIPADMDWGWAGFGAAKPSLVEGLTNVKQLALGGWHALAVVA